MAWVTFKNNTALGRYLWFQGPLSNSFFREYHALIPQHLQRTRQGLCFERGCVHWGGGLFLLRKGRGHPALSDLGSTSAFEPLDPLCSLLVRACLPPEEASNLTWDLTRWQSGALSSPNKNSSPTEGRSLPVRNAVEGTQEVPKNRHLSPIMILKTTNSSGVSSSTT